MNNYILSKLEIKQMDCKATVVRPTSWDRVSHYSKYSLPLNYFILFIILFKLLIKNILNSIIIKATPLG